MGSYSIKELEHLSGIKAHTIRIWEKRHKVIQPLRSPTNIRLYSDEDLKKIINISLLNNHGYKISKIVTLTTKEISEKVLELGIKASDRTVYIDRLVVAMIDLNEHLFAGTMRDLTKSIGFEQTVVSVVYPFLEKVGILWQSSVINPAQEHFISQLIRQKISAATDNLPLAAAGAPVAVLFLPENELHELGLIFYNYLLREKGYKTWYLGQTVPYADVTFVCRLQNPSLIISSVSNYFSPEQTRDYFSNLCTDFPSSRIFLAGAALKKVSLAARANLTVFEGAAGLRAILDSWAFSM